MDFQKFSGDNPRLWKDRCEVYFEVYSISDMLKTRFASLNFEGPAATWLQSAELRGRFQSWPAMYEAVFSHFDRDQYPLTMKQLDALKQSGSVQEYFIQFQQLAHHILLYNYSYDDVYFVTYFLGGLKDEIRSPIALHRPPNLETAYSLALIQEEELAAQKSKHTKWEPKQGRYPAVPDKFKGNHKREEPKPGEPRVLEDKWGALKSYRKANGICFTCGEKWQGKGHKCPDKISINVIQELMEMCQLSADP